MYKYASRLSTQCKGKPNSQFFQSDHFILFFRSTEEKKETKQTIDYIIVQVLMSLVQSEEISSERSAFAPLAAFVPIGQLPAQPLKAMQMADILNGFGFFTIEHK